MARKKIKWGIHQLFLVPQRDGKYSTGVILDSRYPNVAACAFFDERVTSPEGILISDYANEKNLISLVEVTVEQLSYGAWPVIGESSFRVARSRIPNEEYRSKNWIGAITYDAALVEDFLNAFYKLSPWDDWYDPNFLDEFLISPDKKPKDLIYIKKEKSR